MESFDGLDVLVLNIFQVVLVFGGFIGWVYVLLPCILSGNTRLIILYSLIPPVATVAFIYLLKSVLLAQLSGGAALSVVLLVSDMTILNGRIVIKSEKEKLERKGS